MPTETEILRDENERLRASVEEIAKGTPGIKVSLGPYYERGFRHGVEAVQVILRAALASASPKSEHDYTSTACQHGMHDRCRKECKFCGVACRCDCGHKQVTEMKCKNCNELISQCEELHEGDCEYRGYVHNLTDSHVCKNGNLEYGPFAEVYKAEPAQPPSPLEPELLEAMREARHVLRMHSKGIPIAFEYSARIASALDRLMEVNKSNGR